MLQRLCLLASFLIFRCALSLTNGATTPCTHQVFICTSMPICVTITVCRNTYYFSSGVYVSSTVLF